MARMAEKVFSSVCEISEKVADVRFPLIPRGKSRVPSLKSRIVEVTDTKRLSERGIEKSTGPGGSSYS